MKPARYSLKASFRYALEGILQTIRTETHMKIHLAAAAIVFLAAALLNVGTVQWLFLVLAVSLVMAAELLNTAVEAVVDLVSPEAHPLAKRAKDAAAGAVLVTAGFAVVTGCIIFYIPVTDWLSSW
ncbi:diacylglycerol kinase family protein [Paenibacillus sp. F411]|nr:diacylglycerol kinase family protein [Paenibacillus sp. F411]